jgi:hypothetical protein
MEAKMMRVAVLSPSPKSKYPLLRPALGELCEHDHAQVERLLDAMVQLLQEKYGCTRQKAETEVEQLLVEVWLYSRSE